MRRVISVGGLAVLLTADEPARWHALDALFGLCPTSASADGVIQLCFAASRPPVPERPPDVAFSDVDLWYTDAGVVTRHHEGIVVARDGDTIVAGGRAGGDGSAKAFRRTAQHVLADAMAAHGRFALHAAVVLGPGALVVLGDTGAGKSTLAVAALRLGWSVVTDDIAWIAAGADGGPTVAGFPKPLHAPPEIVDGLPVGADRVPGDPRERFVLRGGLTVDDVAHRIRGIVLVRHGAAAATLGTFPMGPRLLTMVMRSFPLQGSPTRVREFFPLAARLSHTPVALLEHAADPAVRAAEAASLLRRAAARFDLRAQ